MKRKFTLRSTLRSFLLLSLWLFLRPDAMAQTYCSPTFNLGTGFTYSFNSLAINSTTVTIPQLASNTTPSGQDMTSSVFTATSGSAATVTISNTSYNSATGGALFVDWNKDGDFNDANEFIFTFSGSATVVNAITPPVNLPSGNYRMRLLGTGAYSPTAGTACADFTSATYIASVNGNGNWIDFTLSVTNPYTCFPPDSVTNYALSATTASFVWRPSTYTSSQGYRWVVVPGGLLVNSTPVAFGSSVGSAPVTVSGLSPSTVYSFYVRSGCSASPTDSSVWVGPVNFTTLGPQCNSMPLPVTLTSSNPISVCYGSSTVLTAADPNTGVSGIVYQWQQSNTGTGNWTAANGGSGATSLNYTTPPITQNIYYRVQTTCSFTSQSPSPVFVDSVRVSTTSVPYFQDFSTIANGQIPSCYSKNINPSYSSFSVRNDFASASGVVKPAIRADFPSGTGNPPSPNNFFTLPALNLTGGVQYAIRFEYARSNSTYPAYLQMFVNNTAPNTAFVAGSPAITSSVPLFDKTGPNAITANGWQTGLVLYTPPSTGTYYFSWYTNTPEAVSITNGTAIGLTNINIYVNTTCNFPTGQPTAFTSSTTDNSVTGSFTAPVSGANGYLVVRTPGGVPLSANPQRGTTYTAYGAAIGNGTVVFAGHNPPFTDTALLANTTYTYTIFSYNDLCTGGPLYDTVAPLIGTATTIGTGKTYIWNRTVAADFGVATNWTPARYAPDPSDILLFNNSVSDTAVNLPANTLITRLQVANNTTVRLKGANNTLSTLTLRSDNDPTTNELQINNGSALMLDDPSAFLQINFSGTGATALIAGTLELVQGPGTTIANVGKLDNFLDLTGAGTITPVVPGYANAVCTVAATGTLAEGNSAVSNDNCINSSYNTLIVNGTVNYRYQTGNANAPYANYQPGSTFLISGYTTATGGPSGGQGQAFWNVTWNCPNETVASVWNGTGPLTVLGTFTMIAGNFQCATNQTFNYYINNFVQTGGTILLNSGNPSPSSTLFISGSFNQTGGTLTTNCTTAGTPTILAFNGTSGMQEINFNISPSTVFSTAAIQYRVMNPNGIHLTGSASLGSTFNIGNNASVRISSGAANPINTSLTLAYGTTLSGLYYDSAAYLAPMTASVFPAANGPQMLFINVGSGNAVTMPFDRSVPASLTLTSGDIDVNSHTLTIGISVGTLGSISGTGLVRLTTGSLARWYGTTGLPIAPQTSGGIGYYPIAYGQANRAVSLYFSSSTALSTGGIITVKHTPTTGTTSFPSTLDAPATVNLRTNAFWSVTSSGVVVSGTNTFGIKITPGYLFSAGNLGDVDVVESTPPILGTYVAASITTAPLFAAERKGLTLAQLTGNNLYVGVNTADTQRVWTAINTGNWNTGSTWDVGVPPAIGNLCVINPNVTVSVAAAGACKSLINNGQLITTGANTLTVDSALVNNDTITVNTGNLIVNGGSLGSTNGITNNGLFNIGGSGTVRLGPAGGSNKPFNNGGILNITGGTFNLNGNLNIPANTYFNMSGGALNVDGNAAGNTANSVGSGSSLVNFASSNINWTNGKITIVDPHAANSTSVYALVYGGALPMNLPATDTLQFGDGASADAGGSTSGFILNPGSTKMTFGTVICNTGNISTGATGTNRFVSLNQTTGILGDLWVLKGGEYRPLGTTTVFNGNINVDAGGFFTSTTLTLGNYTNGSTLYPATPFQKIQGGPNGVGTYRNAATGATGNFTNIVLASATPRFDLFGSNVSFSGTISFSNTFGTPSKMFMGNNVLIELAGASVSSPSQSNGWVVGTYQKTHAAAGGINGTFPIGDSSAYTPIAYTATIATAGALQGYITSSYPGISGSILNPTKTLKRAFYIIPVNGLTFNPAVPATATLSYDPGDISIGIIYSRLIVAHDFSTTGAGPWTYPVPTNAPITSGTNQLVLTNLANLQSVYVVGEPCPATTIFTQPVSVNTCSGNNVTFTTVATGLTLSYQWQKSVNGAPFANIGGATSATFTISNSTIADTGAYRVIVTGICAAPVTSNIARLTLTSAATITTQPVSHSVCIGAPVTFTVDTTAQAPATLQWYRDGIPLPVTGTTYTIPATTLSDAGNIYAVVTNVCRADTSDTAKLRVNPLPIAAITTSGSLSICSNGSVVLTATPGVGYTYQWYMNGGTGVTTQNDTARLAGGYHVTIVDSNGCTATSTDDSVKVLAAPPAAISFVTSPAFCAGGNTSMMVTDTSSDYTYDWLHGSGAGNVFVETNPVNHNFLNTAETTDSFKVIVTNSIGCSDTSAIAYVTANPLPAPFILSTTALSICNGHCDTLNAFPRGSGYSFIWYQDGFQVSSDPANDSFYVACTGGSYTVQVTTPSGCSALSAATILTVNPVPVATVTALGPTTFCPGGNVVLEAGGGTGYTYAWYQVFGPNFFGPLATQASYTAAPGAPGNTTYTVIVKNASGCADTATNTVVTVSSVSASISVTGSLSICQGSSANLCANPGAGYTYLWQYNSPTGWITYANTMCVNPTVAGQYRVIVTNPTGCTATSNPVTITVLPVPVATASANGPTTFCEGGSVTLCSTSSGTLTYQWAQVFPFNVVSTNSCYTASTTNSYELIVSNAVGCKDTSDAIFVDAVAYPVVSITPGGPTSICQGTTVALTAVGGLPTDTYQWQVDTGTGYYNIFGATGVTYNAGMTGNYVVIATNSTGCATTSAPQNVFVNPVPTIKASGPTSFCWGSSVTLTADAGTGIGITYQWNITINGVTNPVSGANGSSIFITQPGGQYTVQVTAPSGCVLGSDTINVVVFPLPDPVITAGSDQSLVTGAYVAYQWYHDGQPVTGAVASNYNYAQTGDGDYRVLVTDTSGCSGLSAVYHIGNGQGTGVNNVNGKIDVNVYPNPATAVIHIDAPVKVNVSILGIDGKQVMQQDDATSMDISALANGVYTVRVTDKDGVLIKIQKLVKNGN